MKRSVILIIAVAIALAIAGVFLVVGGVGNGTKPSFAQDIQPILSEYCIECHGVAEANNGLRLDSYQGVMRGTQYGAIVYPGDPSLSNLLVLIKHESSPEIWMPYHRQQISPNKIQIIENWIENGAPDN